MPKAPFFPRFGRDENPLPFGGAADIFDRILYAMTKEEEDETVEKVQKVFGS
jgi:hypothetical protein